MRVKPFCVRHTLPLVQRAYRNEVNVTSDLSDWIGLNMCGMKHTTDALDLPQIVTYRTREDNF